MNIFILSWILDNCVVYHNDKHCLKLVLESCQMLSTCYHLMVESDYGKDIIYKPTHKNHPCTIWTRECRENYIWLCHLGLKLVKEYCYRYDRTSHACYPKLMFLIQNIPKKLPVNGKMTPFRLAMPEEYKSDNPVESYRKYYLNDKTRMLVWRKREIPHWVPSELHYIHYESEIKRVKKKLTELKKKTVSNRYRGDKTVLNSEIKTYQSQLNTLEEKYALVK